MYCTALSSEVQIDNMIWFFFLVFKSTKTFSPGNLLFYEIYFLQLEHTLQSDFIVYRLYETIYQTKVVFDFMVETIMYFVMIKVWIFMHLQILFKSM